MSDHTDDREPLLHIPLGEFGWYGPGHYPHPYILLGGECRVLERAIQRMGTSDHPELVPVLAALLGVEDVQEVSLGEPNIHTYAPDAFRRSPLEVPVHYLNGGTECAPATAVAYVHRRFGEGRWVRLGSTRVLRHETTGGIPVALVSIIRPP